jgi:formylglycine-generating enzyme required for sulfatase activity
MTRKRQPKSMKRPPRKQRAPRNRQAPQTAQKKSRKFGCGLIFLVLVIGVLVCALGIVGGLIYQRNQLNARFEDREDEFTSDEITFSRQITTFDLDSPPDNFVAGDPVPATDSNSNQQSPGQSGSTSPDTNQNSSTGSSSGTLPSNYSCPDIAGVRLSVGARAVIVFEKVNLRSSAVVPNEYSSNIVAELVLGAKMTVIGGPQCSHDGTWWQIQADSGQVGWMREYLSSKRLLDTVENSAAGSHPQVATNPPDGSELVFIPAGSFTMGMTSDQVNALLAQCSKCSASAFQASMPAHQVYLSNYWIYKTEVTNRMYSLCVSNGYCTTPNNTSSNTRQDYYNISSYQDYPVVYVNWHQANQYCLWAGGRLPTEAEWEKAARGTDARLFPWGDQYPMNSLANVAPFVNDTTAVGSYPQGVSPYGVFDMAGNVYEWVFDWFGSDYYSNSLENDPTGPSQSDHNPIWRSVKGGSWGWTGGIATSGYHDGWGPDESGSGVGFRCVIDMAG